MLNIDNITLNFIQSVSYLMPYWAYFFQVPFPQFIPLMCLNSETCVYTVRHLMFGTIVWISSHSSTDSITKLSNHFSLCCANVTWNYFLSQRISIVKIYTSHTLLQTSVTQKNILGFRAIQPNEQDTCSMGERCRKH